MIVIQQLSAGVSTSSFWSQRLPFHRGRVGRAAKKRVNLQGTPLVLRSRNGLRSTERTRVVEIRATESDGDSPEDNEKNQEEKKTPQLHDTLVYMFRLPFIYASTLAQTNDHWLEQRNRSRWWSRGYFPRLPKFTVRDAMKDENLNHPFRLIAKMAPLGVIFFCASFNLCILQTMKDSLIVSTIGAESLPFLASFGVLPASFIFFGIYHYLLNKLPQKMVFYATVFPLLCAYAFFVIFLYPASSWLHPHGFFDALASSVPCGLHGLLRCIENWTFSFFFCTAEIWGVVVISVLFWSLANDVCTVKEAKTIYPLMGLSANLALVFAGKLIKVINQKIAAGSTLLSYRILIGIVVFNSLLMMTSKLFIDKNLPTNNAEDSTQIKKKDFVKRKGTFKDGLKVLQGSPKILNLALLVIGYSVSHKFFEIVWKGQLKMIYPSTQQYQSVLADVSVWTGASTITMMLTGKFIFQYLGWGVAASIPPIIMLITGSIFYLSFLALNNGTNAANLTMLGVIAGNATQVATRAAKFSLFDPAKEMVYIEMSKEEKGKGKAAVDLVGSQVGKTGASWVSQALLLGFGSISASTPIFGVLYVVVILTWLFSVKRLQQLLIQTEEERKKEKAKLMESSQEEENSLGSSSSLPAVSQNGNIPPKTTPQSGTLVSKNDNFTSSSNEVKRRNPNFELG